MQATNMKVLPVSVSLETIIEEKEDDLALEQIVQPPIAEELTNLEQEVKYMKEQQLLTKVKVAKDKIKTKKDKKFSFLRNVRLNASTYLTREKVLKYKRNGQANSVKDDVMHLFNKYNKEPIRGRIQYLCQQMMIEKAVTISEVLQLHFFVNTKPEVEKYSFPGYYNMIDRGIHKMYTKYEGTPEEVCEITEREHKYSNNHHPEYMRDLFPQWGSTLECMFDLWSCAMRISETWRDAYYTMISWLVEDEFNPHGYQVREKFACLNPYEILLFYYIVNKCGITSGKCVVLERMTRKRNAPLSKEAAQADFSEAYSNKARENNWNLMKIPEVAYYYKETKIHISQVNHMLMRTGLKAKHDYDKLQYTNLIMGAYKWSVMPKLATPTCDDCENPFCKDCSNQDFSTSLQSQVTGFVKWTGKTISDAIPNDMKAIMETAYSTFKDITTVMTTMKDKMMEFIQPIMNILGIYNSTLPDFSAMVEIVKYYIIYINTTSGIVKSIAMYAILNTLGIFNSLMKILHEWLGSEEIVTEEGAQPTNFSETAMNFLSQLGDHLLSVDPKRTAIVLSMIIFVICGYRLKSSQINTIGKDFAEYMRNLHFVSAGLLAFSKIFETLTAAVKFCFEWVSVHVFRRTPSDAKEKEKYEQDIKDFSAWYGKLVIFSADESLNLLMQSTVLTQEAKDLVTQGYAYLKYKAEGKLDKDVSIMMNNAQRMMQKVHNIITRASALTDFRPTPIHLQFFGNAGVGKSTLFKTMTDRISAKHYKGLTQKVYPMSSSTDHFDGYCGQPIVLIDDMFPANDYKDVVPLLTMISNCPMHVPMAHLEDKGMLFTSDIIFSTTNTPYPVFKDLFCKEAIWRRRHMLVNVKVDQEVINKASGKFDIDLYKAKYPGINSYDYPHLRFTFYSPTTQNVTMDDATPVKGLSKPLTDLSFTEFMERVETKMDAHFTDEQEFKNKSNMTKMRGLCDQLKEIDKIYNRLSDYSQIYENNFKVETPVMPQKQNSTPIPEVIPEPPKPKIPLAATVSYKDEHVKQVLAYWETQCDGISYYEDIIEDNIMDGIVSCIRNSDLAFAEPVKILARWDEVKIKIAQLHFRFQTDLTTSGHQKAIEEKVFAIIDRMKTTPFLAYFMRAATYMTLYGHLIPEMLYKVLEDTHAAFPYKFVCRDDLCAPMEINLEGEAQPTTVEKEEDMLIRVENYKESIRKNEQRLENIIDNIIDMSISVDSRDPTQFLSLIKDLDPTTVDIGIVNKIRSTIDCTIAHNKTFSELLMDLTLILDSLTIERQNLMETERKYRNPKISKFMAEDPDDVETEWWRLEDPLNPGEYMLKPKIKYEYALYKDESCTGHPVLFPVIATGTVELLTHIFSIKQLEDAFEGTGEVPDQPLISTIFWHYLSRRDGKWIVNNRDGALLKGAVKITGQNLYMKKDCGSLATLNYSYRTSVTQFFRMPEPARMRLFNIYKLNELQMNIMLSLRNRIANNAQRTFKTLWGSITGAVDWIWQKVIKKHWMKCAVMMVGSIALIGACTAFSRLFIPKETSAREHRMFGKYSPDVPHFTSLDGVQRKIVEACCPVSINMKSGQGFRIAPKVMLVPHHMFQNTTGDYYTFSYQTKEGIMNGFYLPKTNVIRIHDSDLAIVHSEKFPQWADLRKYLRKNEDNDTEDGLYNVTLYNKHGELKEVYSEYGGKKVNYTVKYNNGSTYTAGQVYISKTPIEVGSSGGVVLNKQPNGQHGRTIVGFQSFVLNGYSYSTGLTQETFDEYYKSIARLYPTLERPSFVNPDGVPIATNGLIDSNLMIEGTVPEDKQVFVPTKSELIPTPLISAFPLKRIPAILSEHSKYAVGDPIRASINKYSRDTQMEPPREITDEVVKERGFIIKHSLRRPPKILTWTEILEGNLHMPHVDVKTSPGYPWVNQPRPLPGKKTWLRFKDDGHIEYVSPELVHQFTLLDDAIRQNHIPESLCIEIKKDELRPIAKALGLKSGQEHYYLDNVPVSEWPENRAPKTRSITIMDMTWILVFRKYFGDLQSLLMAMSDGTNSYCIGINAESPAAANAYYSCKSLNTHGFALDASNWDGHFAAWLMYRVLDLIEAIAPAHSQEERNARVCIVEYTLYSFILYKDICIQKMQGMISGSPGTSFFNTLGHIILADTQWKMIAIAKRQPQLALLTVKDANCKDYMYGDDRITVINNKFDSIFTIEDFAKLYEQWGWPVTSATKDGFFSKQPIEELTFLKRTFIPDPENTFYIRWALDKTSIESLLQYIRKTHEPRRQLMQNIYTALDFAADWGEEYYTELVTKINYILGRCKTLQLPIVTPNYIALRRIKMARYFNTCDQDPRAPPNRNLIWCPLVDTIPGRYNQRIQLKEYARKLHECIFSTTIAMKVEGSGVGTQVQTRSNLWSEGELELENDDDVCNDNGHPI